MPEQITVRNEDQDMPNVANIGSNAANGFGFNPASISNNGVSTVYTTTVLGDPLAWQGTLINEYTCMTLPSVYRAVSVLSSLIASLGKNINQMEPSGLLTLRRDHYLNELLNNEINPLATSPTFWAVFMHHALNWGNGYAFIDGTPGNIQGLYNLPPDRVFPFRYRGKQWYAVMTEGYATPAPVPAEQVLHLPSLIGFDGMRGYPTVQMLAQGMRIGKAAEGFGDRFFSNGATGIGAIETDQQLKPEQLNTLKDLINQGHSGIDQAHKWIILSHGLHAKPFTMAPEQAQFLETRTYAIQDVARVYGVPPHILFDLGRATWNNVNQLSLELVKYTLHPNWIVPLEAEIRRKLFSQAEKKAGLYVRFDIDGLQRGDPDSMVDAATKRLLNGLGTPDEERAILGRPAYPDGIGSKPRVPANTVPLGQQPATEQAAPKPQDPQPPQIGQEQASKPAAVTLQHFSGLIASAADRVHAKAYKASQNALNKYREQPDQFTTWANVFSGEMQGYAGKSLAPIFQTYAQLAGKEIDHEAHAARIGESYASNLRGHLYRIGTGEDSTAPDLSQIAYKMGTHEREE